MGKLNWKQKSKVEKVGIIKLLLTSAKTERCKLRFGSTQCDTLKLNKKQ